MTRARVRVEHRAAVVAGAIADPTRLALLREFESAADALAIRTLSQRFSLHENAVRQHVTHLRDAGPVLEEVETTARRAVHASSIESPRTAQVTHGAGTPTKRWPNSWCSVADCAPARAVGADYGRRLAATAPEDTAVAVLTSVAPRHGFQPTSQATDAGVDLVLGRCPFAASVTDERLVCRCTAASRRGSPTRSATPRWPLDTAPPPSGGCRTHLRLTDTKARTRARVEPAAPPPVATGPTQGGRHR